MGFAEQEKIREQEKLIKRGNYTYSEKGLIMATKPCNAGNLTNYIAVKYSTIVPEPRVKPKKEQVILTVAQRANRLQHKKLEQIEKENEQ